jgi:outer membrane protein OmpA-like peptidoglycan-associated protein
LGSLTAPAAAQEDQQGFALGRFHPAPVGDRMFGVQSPYTAGDLDIHAGLLADYALNPLVVVTDPGGTDEKRLSIVSGQFLLHLNGSLALFNRLTVNIDIPVALAQGGESPFAKGRTFESPDGADFGDLRIGLRGTLYGGYFDLFQLALGGYLFLPTGATGPGSFVSDGTVRGALHAIAGGRSDRFVWAANVGPEIRGSLKYEGQVPQGTLIQFGAGVGFLLDEGRNFQLGPEISGALLPQDVSNNTTNLEGMLGAKYRFLNDFEAGLGLGAGFTAGVGTPAFRGVLSFAYTPEQKPPVPDRDKDGVPDAEDACPDVPGVKHPDPKKNGCPSDRDEDKILDTDDACPDVPGVADPDPKKHGCPPPNDRDRDKITDDKDACPDVPGVASPDPKKHGCPPDRDGDGILDDKDACPDEPGVPDPDPKKNGCPPPKDRDKDGILDEKDACPDVPGVADPDPKKHGCPPDRDNDGILDPVDACPDKWGVADPDPKKHGCPKSVILTDNEIVILQQVQFDFAKATIRPVSNSLLDEVASVLRDHPELLRLEVQGHTDNKGQYNYNMKLSQARADAVMAALVARGVAADRMVARGYGPDKPLRENTTEVNRQINRRVQFVILEKKKK